MLVLSNIAILTGNFIGGLYEMWGDTRFLSKASQNSLRTCVAWGILQAAFLRNPECGIKQTHPKPSGLIILSLTTSVYTVSSVSLWTVCFFSLQSSLFMKHHTLYNKTVYCYDVATYFPARRTYFCAMTSVHYLSSCAGYPLSWQILIIPKATKKSIYTTFLPDTAPLLCDVCYYCE
jgi:hypothetical protein